MRHAIIDIGSNAIRAVIHEKNSLCASEVYNEKFRSDLIGLLDLAEPDVKHSVYLVIQHFVHVFKHLKVQTIKCVATAVLRNHQNAPAFVKLVKDRYDIEIEVISGEKEAYLSAAGLMMGINKAEGLVADLGGGSLELAEIKDKEVGKRGSLALGTNIIETSITEDEIKDTILKSFEYNQYKNLYLIGGAFRMLGRAYMEYTRYPLKNLHNLCISSEDFGQFLDRPEEFAQDFDTNRMADQKGMIILKTIIDLFGIEKVIISNYGLKEGVRFVNLPAGERAKDIVRARCEYLSGTKAKDCKFSEYYQITQPLLIEPDHSIEELIELVIMFSTINVNVDKATKASFMADYVISCDVPFTHKQRVMIAIALSYIFGAKPDHMVERLAKKVLSREEQSNALIIGCVLKIAHEIDGPLLHKPSFKFLLKERYIEIDAKEILPRPVFERICDRLRNIAVSRRTRRY